ncbi:MAG: M48 family metallopeptidase [Alphaproteobacteria bacterium]
MTEPAKLGLTTYRLNNNIKSILLLVAFPLLLLLLLGVIFFFVGVFTLGQGQGYGYYDPFESLGLPQVLGTGSALDLALSAIYAWWPTVIGIAAIWTLIGYFFNDAIIHMATGAHPVTREEQPELYNLLENLCISRGLTTPKLYIIDTDVMNAYASGIDEKSYAITVTRGILEQLNKREMEAVLAHELTHIIDRDTRVLIVTIVFTGMISFIAQMLWRSIQVASYGRRSRSRDGGGAIIIIMLVSAVAMAIGYMLALVLRFAISRRREYMADAGSVELTKDPSALISALKKISANPDVPHVPSEVKQMFIENPPSAFDLGGLFATHPPIEARIKVLEELGGLAPERDTAGASVPSVHPASPAPVQATDARQSDPWQTPGPHKSPWE